MVRGSTDLVREWFRRVWEEGDLDAIGELMHPENLSLGLVSDPVGLESFKAVFHAYARILTDIEVSVDETFEEGDHISGRWVLYGTHRGSGKRISFPGALFARVKEGKFLECTNYIDYLDFFVQTGALPSDTLQRCLSERNVGLYSGSLADATLSDMRRVWEADDSHFYALFETSVAALAVVDLEDRIQHVNRTFAFQFGLDDKDLIGKAFHDLIHAGDSAEEAQLFRLLRDGPMHQFQMELRMLRRGAVAWVQLSTLGPQQTPDGPRILRSVQDITTKRLEKMVRFQEQERKLLATDLHDALAQNLALMVIQIQTALALQTKNDPRLPAILTQAQSLGQRMSRDLAVMMNNLRSPVSEGMELSTALQELSEDMSDEQCSVHCEFVSERPILPGLASMFAYRIVQEAVQNARRHGQARHVRIVVVLTSGKLKGRVTDDGNGFDVEGSPGNGLPGMRERCELLGGRFWVEAGIGAGASVRFELPIPDRGESLP